MRAEQAGASVALTHGDEQTTYAALAAETASFASMLRALGAAAGARVAVYLEKRRENVVAFFGASAAGCVLVPVNPVLRPEQVAHILQDCSVTVLVTSPERYASLGETLARCPGLRHVVVVGGGDAPPASAPGHDVVGWRELATVPARAGHRRIETDVAAIFYTSGSTGRPKGVVLSHRNLVAGATSVASYLENHAGDTLLAALPLSFDAGFSQLTTAFSAGARVVLLNYLLPKDAIRAVERERVTGFTAVPPMWIQLARLPWPEGVDAHLRYFATTGGRMPLDTLERLRRAVPRAKPYLMYGLTEAFRATYLPPDQVDARPDSIGKAIPNTEILVLREDGSPCDANEPGELVQRGPLVALGYWNDAERTAERFRPLPAAATSSEGRVLPEIAVFSGDVVRRDEEGYLYFIGRRDEMIKTSGYRVSPNEVEEIVYATGLVHECAAFGVDHSDLGQVIHVAVTVPVGSTVDGRTVVAACKLRMPTYMVPVRVAVQHEPLPRGPNGKIDRRRVAEELRAVSAPAEVSSP